MSATKGQRSFSKNFPTKRFTHGGIVGVEEDAGVGRAVGTGKGHQGAGCAGSASLDVDLGARDEELGAVEVGRVVHSEVLNTQQVGPGGNGTRNGELILRSA